MRQNRPAYYIPSLAIGAAILATAPVLAAKPAAKAFVPQVTLSANGNAVLGNPAAKTKIVEYLSYTCSHCAHFHADGYGTLRDSYIAKGTHSLELRPVMHNVAGLAAALAVQCGGPGRTYRTHKLFMETQDVWLTKIVNAPAATAKTFETGAPLARIKAVARYAGFYDMMAGRKVTEAQLTVCLSDQVAVDRVLANTQLSAADPATSSTPAFLVNGKAVAGRDRVAGLFAVLAQ